MRNICQKVRLIFMGVHVLADSEQTLLFTALVALYSCNLSNVVADHSHIYDERIKATAVRIKIYH